MYNEVSDMGRGKGQHASGALTLVRPSCSYPVPGGSLQLLAVLVTAGSRSVQRGLGKHHCGG